MRNAIWLFLLFVAAVAAALFLGDNRATVTLFWHPYRVDMSLNFLLVILLLLFSLIALTVRAFASIKKVQLNASQWRQQQKERGLQQQYLQAMQAFAQGNYAEAQTLAESTIAKAQILLESQPADTSTADTSALALTRTLQGMAHWIAAESAYALNEDAIGDVHYQQYLEQLFASDLIDTPEQRPPGGDKAHTDTYR